MHNQEIKEINSRFNKCEIMKKGGNLKIVKFRCYRTHNLKGDNGGIPLQCFRRTYRFLDTSVIT